MNQQILVIMKKIFKIYNSVSTDVDLDGMIEVKDIHQKLNSKLIQDSIYSIMLAEDSISVK
jgi:hypothetical protein